MRTDTDNVLGLAEVAAFFHDQQADLPLSNFVLDSRLVKPGDVFVAALGAHQDGADFAKEAMSRGAVAVLSHRAIAGISPCWVVDDPQQALAELAVWQQTRYPITTIAVTGSVAKTSVCQLLAHVLSKHQPTHVTPGNYNTEWGLPLTLLSRQRHHRYQVLEMGAAKPGDIHHLMSIAKPQIGICTGVYEAHLGNYPSRQSLLETKSMIYADLPTDGLALLAADGSDHAYFHQATPARVVSFSLQGKHADYRLTHRGQVLLVEGPQGALKVTLPVWPRHQVENAAWAVVLALELGLPQTSLCFDDLPALAQRMQRLTTREGFLVDDTYNAAPRSVRAAIDYLATQPQPAWLVLTDMAELGPDSKRWHAEIGCYANGKIAGLVTVGSESQLTYDRFEGEKHHFASKADLLRRIVDLPWPPLVLVKGSRLAKMEEVVAKLREVL